MHALGVPGQDHPVACAGHHALLYEGADEFVGGVAAFLREGLDAGERVLAAASRKKLAAVRDAVGPAAAGLDTLDAEELYASHGPMFRRLVGYVTRHGVHGRGRVRVVAEPPLAGRDPADVRTYLRYEAAANVAFSGYDATVLCPYDASSLPSDVIEDAQRTHPEVIEHGQRRPSRAFTDPRAFIARPAPVRELPADAPCWPLESVGDV